MKSRVPLFIGLAVLGLALCLFGFWAISMRTQKPPVPIPATKEEPFSFPQDASKPVEPAPFAKAPALPPRGQPVQPISKSRYPAAVRPVTTQKSMAKAAKKPARPAPTKKKSVTTPKKKAGPTRKWKVSYRDMRAQKISVIGTFNNWNPRKNSMTKGYNHTWSATLSLSPGEYHYQFWVDGKARRDPQNPRATTDGKGGKVSVMTIRVR